MGQLTLSRKRRLRTPQEPATPITSTTYSIDSAHPDFADAALEFGPGDSVRRKVIRLRGPRESKARQRMIAVERIG